MKKKRFSEEQMVAILREGAAGGETISEVCRRHGNSEPAFQVWQRKFERRRDAAVPMPETDVKRVRGPERENQRLKRLLAGRDLEVDVMKELVQEN